MREFDAAASFGPDIAARYDETPRGDESAAAQFLSELAGEGRALEFAIGTGRIALPLQGHGVSVDGIELSPDMVDVLRRKPGGEQLHVVVGDMSAASTGSRYDLVYLVFNTIFNLQTADAQVRCFENAARHLAPGGVFVVETALPHAWIAPGKEGYVVAEGIESDAVQLGVARYDPATQLFQECHVRIGAVRNEFAPLLLRLITPGEMDLMARIAGLELVDRFANWERGAFGVHSREHVSVYGWRGDHGGVD
ncbi:MAG: class I SAM-dependent methyltransferase [Planctomycetota bacterium]